MSFRKFILSTIASTAVAFAATGALAQEVVTTDIDWSKGSPRYTSSDGQFQFRVRGRYMMDAYAQDVNFAGTANDFSNSGFATRRARLGVEGKLNQVFNFKAEATYKSGGSIEFNDVWASYDNNGLEVIVGQNYFTSSLDGLTSSLVHLTNERSLVTQAFAQDKRNTGIVVRKYSDNWMVVGGLYGDSADNAETANATEARYGQIRGNYAFSNKRGNYLVLGGSARYRDSNQGSKYSYSAKAVQNNYGSNYFSGPTNVLKDENYGLDGFWSHGSLSVMADVQLTKAKTMVGTTLTEYDLKGGAVEVSYYLTGETRSYDTKNGELKGIKPNSPLQDGGIGAWALVGRYDRLDYSDFVASGIKGTEANAYTLGVAWQPTDWVLFRGAYGLTDYKRSNLAGRPDGKVNSFTLRTQFSF